MKKYCIKESYNHRENYLYFNDMPLTDEYQNEVYEKAVQVFKDNNLKNVLDIGCGSGFKLIKYFNDYDFIGIDVSETVDALKLKYPNKKWEISDFNKIYNQKFDLVICSDVIEHLLNPNELITFISNLNFEFLILSTPERNRVEQRLGQYLIDGPPVNQHHVREWALEEFSEYIKPHFNILEHFNLNDYNGEQQLIVAKKYVNQ